MYWSRYFFVASITLAAFTAFEPNIKILLNWLATPGGKSAYAFWLGSKSVYDLITGLMTMLLAITAAFLTLRTYRVNQRAAIANRYQKGVELLGAAADSSKLGGIELLSVVAREDHQEYQEPVIRTLRQFLLERCAASNRGGTDEESLFDFGTLPATDFVVLAALSAVARTNWRQRWVGLEHDDEGLTLHGVHLHRVRFVKQNFSRIRFKDAVFGDVTFEACNFAETFIEAQCLGNLNFYNCSISNSEMRGFDVNGKQISKEGIPINMLRNQRTFKFWLNRS